jgi:dienelactone hydrolase
MRANTLIVWVLAAACAVAAEYPEKAEDSQAIRSQQYRQMDAYLDKQVEQAEARRTRYWSKLDFASPAAYDRSAQAYRDDWSRYLGVPERAAAPWTHRRVKLAEFDDCTAYRVWIETVPGVEAYGILLVPKQVAGRMPALIAVHGVQGTPEYVAGVAPEPPGREYSVYRTFARMAAQRGYVVWCPFLYNHYSEEREPKEGPEATGRDMLHKKAVIAGSTLMGLEIAKIQRAVDYLQSLPEVDPTRIGMYGLSKGGHYTLYTAPLETRIKAAVVSGWFNHRKRKLLAPKVGPGMFFLTHTHRSEYYLPDLLARFGDAELAWMIAPRALMIENGAKDGAVLINDAREEFGRVSRAYGRLGLAEKARFASFEGPHRIDGVEAFAFLDQWLK